MTPLATFHDKNRVVYAALQRQNRRICKNSDSPANTCQAFLYIQQNSTMSVDWLQGPRFIWLDNSDFSGPFLRKLFPNITSMEDSTHLMRRGIRTLTPGHSTISELYFGLCHYLCGTVAELMQADVPIAKTDAY